MACADMDSLGDAGAHRANADVLPNDLALWSSIQPRLRPCTIQGVAYTI